MNKVRPTIMLLIVTALATTAYSGSLDPAAPPAPTMKSLDVVEPRTAISSLPFTISQSGSYYLTGNLEASGSANGIRILGTAISVSIDLNGFSLIGEWASFTGGIAADSGAKIVSVRNGTVRGWDVGISADYGITTRLSQVTVEGNIYRGVQIYGGGEIENSAVIGNNQIGLLAGANTAIRHSRITGNGLTGIYLFGGSSSLESSFISGNGYVSTYTEAWTKAGIWAVSTNRIVNCLVQNNAGDGILIGDSNYIADNHLTQNNASGISGPTGTANRIEGNYLARNIGKGISIVGTGNILMRNTAAGNVAGNYAIAPGNIATIETTSIANLASNIQY